MDEMRCKQRTHSSPTSCGTLAPRRSIGQSLSPIVSWEASDATASVCSPLVPREECAVLSRSERATLERPPMKVIELINGFGIENLHVVERTEPRLGPGVRVMMKAWSLNYRDLLLV